LVEPPFQLNHDGTITVPQKPGIGVEVVKELLEKVTKKKRIFT
jgi:O-succinylbenzoate synthase